MALESRVRLWRERLQAKVAGPASHRPLCFQAGNFWAAQPLRVGRGSVIDMGEDDQEWAGGDIRTSLFGSFAIRNRKKKRKRHEAKKPVVRKPEDGNGGGSGAPQGRSLVEE